MSTEREKTDFPQTLIGNGDKLRRFNPKWYTKKHGNWLEYSVKADRVYCLYCYLFKESGQKDAFAIEGVQCWHRKEERFESHVGLLNGGLPFRGHDESEASLYRGHFIEFLKLFAQIHEEIGKYILSNAPKNCQMTVPSIQKDICNCFAEEVLKMIFEELGADVFSLLVDESRDISKNEQMAVVLRYVDKLGFVKERYIGVVHVTETTALSLKSAIDELFAHRNLSLGRVRGQGYDGASNMSDLLRESQRELLALNLEVVIGSVNNQEMALTRPGDTRWSSHEKTLLRLLTLYPCVIEVLEYIETSAWEPIHKTQANGLQLYMKSFKFVFYLHLMKHILGVTNLLCVALQRKNQDILNAVELVRSTKEELQRYRLEGFDSLLKDVTSFCDKYDIEMINMEDEYVDPKNRRRKTNITNRHHFVVNNFNTVLDMQIQELGNRFNEVTTNLLTYMSSLSPRNNFSSFNKLNLLKLAEMYPYDFTFDEKDKLIDELGHYISNMKKDSRFDNLNGVSDLAKRMVETRKHIEYQLVYGFSQDKKVKKKSVLFRCA
ncbi:zinc finger MYM-type protein 1-like [Helianthus annuus]|uniref:zinc finger MYM-type protein 1-like n=1 Tax=Helianthus annuus TaxID=4232 RepID=UPI000B8F229A|nr:zinc finger MYM-type protein 1-like [Helianthus annuus]